jgi:sugar lactone lactonase YvrE
MSQDTKMPPRWPRIILATAAALAYAQAQNQYFITTFAGGGPPATGMTATATPIGNPSGLAINVMQGTLYIAALNCVFKVDTSGVLTRIAGTGRAAFSGDGGAAIDAGLNLDPEFTGIAVDSTGTVYISDTANNRVRRITVDGTISTIVGNGTATNSGDGGPATMAGIASPTGLVLDSAGQLYVATTSTIRMISSSGVITTIVGTGLSGYSGDGGPALGARLSSPSGLAFDASGNLYIADSGNNCIRKVTPAGTITTVAGNGIQGYAGDGGLASLAELSSPTGIAVDYQGGLLIADDFNNRIRKVSAQGLISTVAGDGSDSSTTDGVLATTTGLEAPLAVAVDANGNLFIADYGNCRIREVPGNGTITTVAGNGVYSYSTDGVPATSVFLGDPEGVTTDSNGNVYIADSQNNRIRKVSGSGTISTFAGDGTAGNSGDGGSATLAQLWNPNDVLMGTSGNLYIAVGLYGVVRMVSSSGIITTLAGNTGYFDTQEGGSPTATGLSFPVGLGEDAYGNLYVADSGGQRVFRISPLGFIATVAGNGIASYAGDGQPAVAATLYDPSGVAADAYGDIFVADTDNNCIREVNAGGMMSTFAGTCAQPGYAGDGGPASLAKLNSPYAVAVDSSGDVWIADSANSRIRMVSPAGIISTVAGNGVSGYTGDGGPATSAEIGFVVGLSIDSVGRVYLADSLDSAIRILAPTSPTCIYAIQSGQTGTMTDTFTYPGSGGSIVINVVTQANCGWTVGELPSWLSIGGPVIQNGPGSFTLTAAANTGASRASQIVIAGVNVEIDQGDPAPPTVLNLSPGSVAPGGSDLSLTVNGTNFVSGSTVVWNSTPLSTSFISDTQLIATVPAAMTSSAGMATISVVDPDGFASGGMIFQIQTGPVATAVAPAAGYGGSQTFTFSFSDSNGSQSLAVLDVLINQFLDGRQSCYVAFVPSGATAGTLYLVDDGGDAGGPFAGSMALPGSESISNNQCTVSGTGSSVMTSGTTLTLSLNIAFTPNFAGNRVVYMAGRDAGTGNSGWQAMGTWSVPGASATPTQAIGVSPADGSGASQAFTFTFTDSGGWQDLGIVNVLFNNFIDGRSGCYIAYAVQSGTLYLVDDAGDAGGPFAGTMALPGAGSVSNSQCTVNGSGSSVGGSGNTLTLTLNMSFKAAFAGNRIFYTAAGDMSGTKNSGWQALGAWGAP